MARLGRRLLALWRRGDAPLTMSQNGFALFNDLWLYEPASGEWTWIGGSNMPTDDGTNSGTYGTQGTAAPGNLPPTRDGAATWTDASGNFWLFGGSFAVSGMGTALLNDLWKFNPTTHFWAWMSGSNQPGTDAGLSTPQGGGTYGSEGSPAQANVPGQRTSSGAWIDNSGKLWLFGGVTPGNNPDVCCSVSNDLWSYDPASGEWTWVSGAMVNGSSAAASYGTQGMPGVGNVPGGRFAAASFIDSDGNLWLFAGSAWREGAYDDLWMFTMKPL